MSLRVWLPLLGNLDNQGLSESNVTAINAIVATAGKIGSCYSFASNSYLRGTNTFLSNSTQDWSYCCWMKLNTTASGQCLFSCRNSVNSNGIAIFYYDTQWLIDDGSRWTLNKRIPISANTWYHICVVRKMGVGKFLYVNGELDSSTTSTTTATNVCSTYYTIGDSQQNATTASGNPLNGYLNDVRVYDHALSLKEIKLISQGLVCHYTLGDRSIQQMNNCYSYPTFNTSSASGGWSHWGGSGHIGTYGQNTNTNYIFRAGQPYSHWVANGSGATYNYLVYQSPAFEGGTRSLCCIIKHENGLPITNSICYPTWNARSGGTPINAWTSIISLSNGFYLCKCENIQQDGSNDLVGVYVTAGNKIYISEGYLENDRVCCSDIFYNDTTIYDCSGYNYHGTRSGTLTVDSNTPRYSVSTQFSSGSHIYTPTINTSGFTNSFTFAWWGYIVNYTGHMMWGFSNGNRLNLYMSNSGNNFYWNTGDGNNNVLGNVKPSDYKNAWHYFAMTGDGTKAKLYIDGEYVASATTYKAVTGTIIYMNGWDSSTSYNCNGKISDFRIYATTLSSEDIKALYQIGASIDKSGNMYAYEFNEV